MAASVVDLFEAVDIRRHDPMPSQSSPRELLDASNGEDWQTQVDQLRAKVQQWTGNPLQVVDVSLWQWAEMRNTDPALFDQITRDGVTVAG